MAASYELESCGGAMPTQAEGRTAGGRPFYFRARHGEWTLEVGEPGWPTSYSDWPWPGINLAWEVASGEDETHGWMERPAVERILEQHLAGR